MWRRVALGVAGLGSVSMYCVDKTINDDWDNVTDIFRSRVSQEERERDPRPRVVILGTGWAALNCLRKLHCDKYDVTIVSPRNYFLFTPLLAGSTVGTVATRSIIEPIRNYCNRSDAEEVKFVQAECTAIDPRSKTVVCRDVSKVKGNIDEFELEYDELIVSCGACVNTFGIEGVDKHALFMKEIDHATKIRNRIIDCFETASIPGQTEEEIDRLLHFAVVGGGPSGVEFAASLHDFLEDDMSQAFPELAPRVRVTLVEAMDGILRMFDPGLVKWTENELKREKIDLWLNTFVSKVGPKSFDVKKPVVDNTDAIVAKVTKDGDQGGETKNREIMRVEHTVPCGMVVWVAGIGTRPLVKRLSADIGKENGQTSRRGLVVNEFMQVKGCENIWAMGDCAVSGCPPTAQVAAQQGAYLGRLLNRAAEPLHAQHKAAKSDGTSSSSFDCEKFGAAPFDYQHKGIFAYTGDHHAVCQVTTWRDDIKGTGSKAYALWASVYWSKLLSLPNRTCVAFDWAKTRLFGRDISRR